MRKLTIILIVLFAVQAYAQKRANIWYFGSNAGMDFNSGAPAALTNGMINTYEGVAGICDSSGALQFYTDGVTVWNRTHLVMPNGTGLMGGGSSSQSAIVIPMPANDSLYYIFCAGDGGGGFSYSIVNMNLDGGNGDITGVKNVMLLTPVTEKLTAAVAQNGVDIWVVVHEWMTDNFYAYLVTPSGINPPVITGIGLVHDPVPNQIGCMKISHDAKKIAAAITYMSAAELFDFDNATGIVSNPITFTGIEDPYGVEFSPDNSRLYFASRAPYTTKALYQYDLNAGSPAAIIASKTYVNQSPVGANNGTLQLGPDKKIYLTNDGGNFLEVINNPDNPVATCGYVANGFNLAPKSSQQGLPNFITTWFSSVTYENSCFGDSTHFNFTPSAGLLGAQWNFDDTASGANNVSFINNPVHLFTAAGNYHVLLIQYYSNGATDSNYTNVIISAPPLVDLGPDSSFCNGDTFQLNAGGGYTNYLWQNGSSDSIFSATASGTFWVRVTQNTCSVTDSITLNAASCSSPLANLLSSDTVFCEKKCIDFFDISTNNPTSWQWFFPGADSVSSNQQNPAGICYNSYGSFDVTLIACNVAGCDTLTLPAFIIEYAAPSPSVTLSNDTLYSSPGFSYQWWNAATGMIPGAVNNFYVSTFGESYFVVITDSLGCSGTSSITTVNGTGQVFPTEDVIKITPNPASDKFQVHYHLSAGKDATLEIFNITGQVVKEIILDHKEGRATVFTESLSPGVYFYAVRTGQDTMPCGKIILLK
jgi:PKD repeat protein